MQKIAISRQRKHQHVLTRPTKMESVSAHMHELETLCNRVLILE